MSTSVSTSARVDHGTVLTPAGKKVLDKPLPNSEPRLRELFEKLQARHGTVLVWNHPVPVSASASHAAVWAVPKLGTFAGGHREVLKFHRAGIES